MLEQSDATGWMASYALSMAAIASILNRHGRADDRPRAQVPRALRPHLRRDAREGPVGRRGRLLLRPAAALPTARSCRCGAFDGRDPAADSPFAVIDEPVLRRAQTVGKRFARLIEHSQPRARSPRGRGPCASASPANGGSCSASSSVEHLLRIFERLFDEDAFLSPYGLRAVSRWHLEHPYHLEVDGMHATIDYEPAESTTAMFGGNSNWRGPIWFPRQLPRRQRAAPLRPLLRRRLHGRVPDRLGEQQTLGEIGRGHPRAGSSRSSSSARTAGGRASAGSSSCRPIRLEGQHPVQRVLPRRQRCRLGASHQTGWTGLVADMIRRSGGAKIPTLADQQDDESSSSSTRIAAVVAVVYSWSRSW